MIKYPRALCRLIAACTLFITGCATIGQLNLLTTDQEVEIGGQAAREVEREVRLYDDPEVEAYIDSLVGG